MSKKIGFYGGSFNPIHFGHINLCLEMAEKHSLDTVLLCPSNISPGKSIDYSTPGPSHRLKMVELAIEDIPHFSVYDYEIEKGGISYTVDTLRELKRTYTNDQLFLILGTDAAQHFSRWKSPEEIFHLATPLVGLRENDPRENEALDKKFFENGVTKTRLLDISSTEIRQRIQNKMYIRHLVPSKVVDYICANQLYF